MRKLASSLSRPKGPGLTVWLYAGLCVSSLACGPGNIKPSDLTPRELHVQVFEKGKLPSCTLYEELGVVDAESGGAMAPGTFESSLAKLRRAAAERGATGILMLTHSSDGKIDRASGTAMRCLPRS